MRWLLPHPPRKMPANCISVVSNRLSLLLLYHNALLPLFHFPDDPGGFLAAFEDV